MYTVVTSKLGIVEFMRDVPNRAEAWKLARALCNNRWLEFRGTLSGNFISSVQILTSKVR